MSAADATVPALRVDIVSDVVCPWCVVGWRQLERALERSGTSAEVHWHPFELNPHMAREGEPLDAHIRAKYGSTAEESAAVRARLSALGDELGIAFRWPEDKRIYPTFDAHRLLHWAGTEGREHALKMALFDAYFGGGRDVADRHVLVELAAAVGLDADTARAVLAEDRFADEVRARERFWLARGIRGVPAVVLGERYLLSGAQGVERYAEAIGQLVAEAAGG